MTRQPGSPTRVGVILTPDNAIDPELPRWMPPDVSIHITRLGQWRPHFEDHLASSAFAARPDLVAGATSMLAVIGCEVTAFACTSASFMNGSDGERAIRAEMVRSGARHAVTSSGAMLAALAALGVRRVAVGTPYDEECSRRLGRFLKSAGLEVVRLVWRPPPTTNDVANYREDEVERLARSAAHPAAEAVFLSCTALPTLEALPELGRVLGCPVLSSNQVTMWAALRALGLDRPLA